MDNNRKSQETTTNFAALHQTIFRGTSALSKILGKFHLQFRKLPFKRCIFSL